MNTCILKKQIDWNVYNKVQINKVKRKINEIKNISVFRTDNNSVRNNLLVLKFRGLYFTYILEPKGFAAVVIHNIYVDL